MLGTMQHVDSDLCDLCDVCVRRDRNIAHDDYILSSLDCHVASWPLPSSSTTPPPPRC